MKFTTAHYLTPGGQMIERSVGQSRERRGGLEPDFPIEQTDSEKLETARLLSQMEYPPPYRARAIEVLEVEAAPETDAPIEAAISLLRGQPVPRKIASKESSKERD